MPLAGGRGCRSGGFPHHKLRIDHNLVFGRGHFTRRWNQAIADDVPDPLARNMQRSKSWITKLGELDVVKASRGHILGNANPALAPRPTCFPSAATATDFG